MKNRNKQRHNRRYFGQSPRKPMLNNEGYYDLTTYEGIKHATAKPSKSKEAGVVKISTAI